MQRNPTLTVISAIIATCFIIVFGCTKSTTAASGAIQQGDSIIEIFALYVPSNSAALMVKYNNVIDAPISGTIRFYEHNGATHNLPFSIPAGYKNLEAWGDNNYLNLWYYVSNYDSTSGGTPPPTYDPSWNVDSVKIVAANCPDKKYGFRALVPADNWDYYHPADPLTVVQFQSNGIQVLFSDYQFTPPVYYNAASSSYAFYLYNTHFEMFSGTAAYPLQTGETMSIPFLRYYTDRNYGSQLNVADTATNGSTLTLTITGISGNYFNASFSGKIWSDLQPDTLIITNGTMQDVPLPVKQ